MRLTVSAFAKHILGELSSSSSRILDLLYRSRDSAETMFDRRDYIRLVTVPINLYADLFLLQLYDFQYMIVIRRNRI